MGPRLFTAASVLSLVLAVAMVLLWVRSFGRVTYLIWWNEPRDVTATVGVGVVAVECTPAGHLEQYVEGSRRGHLFYSALIDDRKPGVPRQLVDVAPGSPSWGFERGSLSSEEANNEVKTPRQWAGFGYGKVTDRTLAPGFDLFYTVKLPLWFLAVVFLAMPVGRTASTLRKRRRRQRGLCHRCGYDLRASTGRCPECGERIREEATA